MDVGLGMDVGLEMNADRGGGGDEAGHRAKFQDSHRVEPGHRAEVQDSHRVGPGNGHGADVEDGHGGWGSESTWAGRGMCVCDFDINIHYS